MDIRKMMITLGDAYEARTAEIKKLRTIVANMAARHNGSCPDEYGYECYRHTGKCFKDNDAKTDEEKESAREACWINALNREGWEKKVKGWDDTLLEEDDE